MLFKLKILTIEIKKNQPRFKVDFFISVSLFIYYYIIGLYLLNIFLYKLFCDLRKLFVRHI